jgi:hypothetical protein
MAAVNRNGRIYRQELYCDAVKTYQAMIGRKGGKAPKPTSALTAPKAEGQRESSAALTAVKLVL